MSALRRAGPQYRNPYVTNEAVYSGSSAAKTAGQRPGCRAVVPVSPPRPPFVL